MLGFIAGRLRRPSTLLTVLRPGPAAAATKRSIHHQLVDRQTKNAPSAAAGCIWATTVAGSCSKAGPAAPKLPLLPGNTPTLRSPSAAAGCSWGLATAAAATGPKSTALAAVCSRGLATAASATAAKSTALAAVCSRGLATATGKSTVLAAVRAKIVGVAVALRRVMVGSQRAHIALARLARIYRGDGSTMPRVATAADMSVVEAPSSSSSPSRAHCEGQQGCEGWSWRPGCVRRQRYHQGNESPLHSAGNPYWENARKLPRKD
ncbi:Os07g0149200 [Oryza sativa Japonica Group]|uniref:Os07g0149200 protein n=1 Tax=Oryza sativa subsp. japonica TaxID=39947 RepID=A0A0P0X2K7_ORYSJ|nr:Os07g0149200 [Oryza sativa Japonica Group]